MEKVKEKIIGEKVVGIIGGMGPEATVDLMRRIIRLTPALDDQDHVRCIVDNNPKIPSRIKAIIDGDGKDPVPTLVDMAKRLELWGADFLAIPCNTAHYYYDEISNAVHIPVLNMVDLLVEILLKEHSLSKKIGLLASPAIRMTKLYETRFASVGLDPVYPDKKSEDDLFKVIRMVKSGKTGEDVLDAYKAVCSHLKSKGADIAIIACTELSALKCNPPIQTIDAAQVLAQRIVDIAKGTMDAF